MAFTSTDREHMSRALALAGRGMYTTTPNPRVGCVLARDGVVVGEGWHEAAGLPHAEANALAMAGEAARGATAYVTLKPCSHFGRTPPCAGALIGAGVARVVAAMQDPNPAVSGAGFRRLEAAGVRTEVGLLDAEARELNIGFISRMTRARPWVRMKVAASIDGRTALANGQSQWITGAAARADGHHWRARACAVLTGAGTVRDDDPRLTVRDVVTPRQPLRVLVDSRLESPPTSKLFDDGSVLVFAAAGHNERRALLERRGAEIVSRPNADGKVDLEGMLLELGRRGINELHVEAGHALNGSLLREDCVDELLLYFAPSVIGSGGMGMWDLPPIEDLSQQKRLTVTSVERIGEDIRIIARLFR
jgi:diaminohydroxyphosphoribosylaminopyrimidine deaminase/5-amino-6-(5-phosphoribosylamino)uracil reductase